MRDQFAFLKRFDVRETRGQTHVKRLIANAKSPNSTTANASEIQMIRFSSCVTLSMLMLAQS
jgi:hypothetical protein